MYFIIAFQIYFILVVYSYFESLREDPSGSTAGQLLTDEEQLWYVTLLCLFVPYKLWSYPVISFPLVHHLSSLLPWLTLFVFPEPYPSHHSLFSLQISLSTLFLNLSVWPLKWKKWVFTWAWSHFWWSHKNGFNVFFIWQMQVGGPPPYAKFWAAEVVEWKKQLNCFQSPLFSLDHRGWALTN